MTAQAGLTDIRDRTLTLVRALGVEPDDRQMRIVEKYARWVDQQVSDAHIDGRAMDREIAGGHEMIVAHDGGGAIYTIVCHESHGADCRLVCGDGCEDWTDITRDSEGAFHGVYGHDGSLIGRHRMLDVGECQAVLWFEQDPGVTPELAEDKTYLFEIGRFPIRPVWAGGGVEWQRVTR